MSEYRDKNGKLIEPGMILIYDDGVSYKCVMEDGEMCLKSELSGYVFQMKYICASHQLMNLTIQENQNG